MWQILLGIYIVVVILSTIVLWSALVMAKKSDHNTDGRLQRMTGTLTDDSSLKYDQILEIPSLSQLTKK